MFPGSVIRKLSRSEEVFAQYEVFTAVTVQLRGRVDADALSEAFDALVDAHPILASHLEPAAGGGWNLVADDMLHAGIVVQDGAGEAREIALDQSQTLLNMRLTLHEDRSELTIFLHHSIADGHHGAGLFDELFSRYTDVVTTGDPGPVNPQPAPQPLEVVLEQRGVKKLGMTGVERFLPVMFAYDLPPSVKPTLVATPGLPQPVPVTRVRLTEQETADLVEFARENRVSVNTVVAAAILMTEWRLRETPHVPIPYVYPVDLRYFLSPPVAPTEATNLVGVATYLAEVGPDTDIVDLATDIGATFRADIADGVVQQSGLNFGVAFEGTPAGLPPLVFCTDVSALPSVRMPSGIELEGFRGQFYCSITVPLDFYGCGMSGDYLVIENHGHSPQRKDSLEAIREVLCTAPSDYGWAVE
ncbi:MAG: acyltransferase [Mycobacterium sp.]|uniref:Phthiocerol/phthiodiolone dimycocerosyl transferase n=1 Tax=Mycobacterium gordonae TaxID=1778 RepID=A0A1A6BBR6_MYCGO|nr:phthiocerol/phthiodiolone dimycocerosyl transferase [Mycobacterium gordonae]MBI2700664.1 phthiocerol/phthiodiolone dimycocerosyl transferase [Mycobacterium sp.]MBX9982942.1 phthiocerol/phthiodiolone dimycocerosyl transferase [Mycobacterium gordonae]MCQ4359860.1 phthiocerol/phthiodiolone dimycocerosyl transferase [Mycobacterium gordonae]OBR99811.1 acyltransferase [Mycobacterium gordonae]PJE16565.1 MAG: acyltransferase [Mycobacterium sp.]